tara:strand:- start:254 stop:412 length:159 start_codon:yes stop_codon:yes gene_type:complete
MLPPLEDNKFHIIIKPTKEKVDKPRIKRNNPSSSKLPEDIGVIFKSPEELKQ